VREDAKEWFIANCVTCGRPFGQEEAWMDNCPVCFKENKGYKLLKGDLAFACLQYEVERLRAALADAAVREDEREQDDPQDTSELAELRNKVADLSAINTRLVRLRAELKQRVQQLEGEVARLTREASTRKPPVREAGPSFDLPLIRKMLLLCHPDKHQNSEVATQVTQWILAQKAKIDR
jgi:hypothetical protein